MRIDWQRYGKDRDTGVRAFAILPHAVALQFSDGRAYLYDAVAPGARHVQRMKELAQRGSGLTTYVNRSVRDRYAGRIA